MNKIAVFSNMYPSKEHPTFGIFVKNQVKLLHEAQVDVEVVTINNPGKGKMMTLQKYMSWFFRSFIFMLKNRKKLSLTHAHYAFPTGLISLMGKKLMGIPYIVTVHGGDIDKMAKKSARIGKLTKQILNEAEKVIVVGERLKNDVSNDFGVEESRIEVMSMGVNTAIFKERSKQDVRIELGLQEDRAIILFVGNVIEAKGLLELVDAFERVVNAEQLVELYIIGAERDQNFSEKLHRKINDKNLNNIHFKKPLGQADLAKWMAAADVLALPSHHEGFGLVALEAMSTGLKVVGTDVGGLSYLLADQAGILVKPKDASSLAEGLAQAINRNESIIAEEMVQKRVAMHSSDMILHKLLQIYEQVGRNE